MNQQEIPVYLFKYFARFIPKDVLKKMFLKKKDILPEYELVVTEILSAPQDLIIEGIDAYIFSPNEKFVEEKIKNSNKTVLYVEYGAFSYHPDRMNGIKEKLALHVACPYSASNNDNLNEVLLMNRMYAILCSILDRMEKDQRELNFCRETNLIEFPAQIVAIDPPLFFERAGWMAIFDYSTTHIL